VIEDGTGPAPAGGTLEPSGGSLERGSFRDRDSRVFYSGGRVLRGLSEAGREAWETLEATSFFSRMISAGKIVSSDRLQPEAVHEGEGDPELAGWSAFLEHARIPFVSYPYEWPFGMLRDAALLELELMSAALAEDMVLKDATPYNVQWFGARPTFIDIPSFVPLPPGEPWAGYRQFCELFLYPLMLQAYKGVPYHAWLRGSIDGIPPDHCLGMMSLRDLFRPGVMVHVKLQAMLQGSFSSTKRDVRGDLRKAGFQKELIVANVRKLTKLVKRLRWKQAQSEWSDYAENTSYDDAEHRQKVDFVRGAVTDRARQLVWDFGCNTGEYSRIAAETTPHVVAIDGDHLAVERLYQGLAAEGNERILPLVMPLNDASPNLGWRGTERGDLRQRGAPDLVLCLALIHHMVIGANIPLAEFVDHLGDLGADVVVEFVSKADPMVETLLRNKEDKYDDYDQEHLERCLARLFEVVRSEAVGGGRRTLYYARRR